MRHKTAAATLWQQHCCVTATATAATVASATPGTATGRKLITLCASAFRNKLRATAEREATPNVAPRLIEHFSQALEKPS